MGTSEAKTTTSYEVLFVGLVCFLKEGRGRRVLLPDGSNPRPNVTPHFAYIAVDPSAITAHHGWYPSEDPTQNDLMESGLFRLPKCTISMTGVANGGGLDTKNQERFLPSLSDADSTARINPADVEAAAEMMVTSGTLEALRATDSDDPLNPNDVAVISRLTVPEDGPILVVVEPVDGSEKRVLQLDPGTSVAVANIAFPDEGTGIEHFSIFEQLITGRKLKGRAVFPAWLPPQLPTGHPLFGLGISIIDGSSSCGNQGCCRPPG